MSAIEKHWFLIMAARGNQTCSAPGGRHERGPKHEIFSFLFKRGEQAKHVAHLWTEQNTPTTSFIGANQHSGTDSKRYNTATPMQIGSTQCCWHYAAGPGSGAPGAPRLQPHPETHPSSASITAERKKERMKERKRERGREKKKESKREERGAATFSHTLGVRQKGQALRCRDSSSNSSAWKNCPG
jgi:hypothetical protein